MSDPMPESLLKLREQYVRELPGSVSELLRALEVLRDNPEDSGSRGRSRALAHQIHGTAGSFGLQGIGDAAGLIELALDQPGPSGCTEAAGLASRLWDALHELPAGADAGLWRRSGPRLLVRSTDGALLLTLAELGRAQLWEVLATPTAEDALEAAARMRPSAALLDAGAEGLPAVLLLADQLRSLVPGPLPIAVCAAGAPLLARLQAARAGASLFLEKPADAPQLAQQLEALFSEAQALRRPIRVLVLREPAAEREAVVDELVAAGLSAEPLEAPGALLEALEQRRPDAVVLGESVAGLDGPDVCRAIRSSLRWRELPLVIVGGSSSAEARLRAADAGADGYLTGPLSGAVMVARLRGLVLRARVQRDRADTDALTGLLLRRPYLDMLAARLAAARRLGSPVAVCLLDLDGFKDLNTRLGHLGADRVLVAFGRALLGAFRLEDLRCRWGGDEFALAFPGASAERAASLLRRMEPRAQRLELDGALAPVPFSAGVAAYPADGIEAAGLLRIADQRLFHAKAAGGGRSLAS